MKNKLKLNIFLPILLFIILFTSISIADAERYTYLNRHFFEDGTYELRELKIDKDLTLTKNSSPYLIEDSIFITNGARLIIEDGVSFIFDNNPQGDTRFNQISNAKEIEKRIVVDKNSSLDILGRSNSPIIFKSLDPNSGDIQGWGTIIFEEGSSGYIKFTDFYNGGFYNLNASHIDTSNKINSSIEISSKDVYIDNCRFKDSGQYNYEDNENFYNAITINKLYNRNHPINHGPEISNCTFDISSPYVIYQKDINDSPILSNLRTSNLIEKSVVRIDSQHNQSGSDLLKDIYLKNVGLPYLIDGIVNIYGSLNINDSIVFFNNDHINNKIIKASSLIVKNKASLSIKNSTLDSYPKNSPNIGWGNIEFSENSIGFIDNSKIKNAGCQYIKNPEREDTFDENLSQIDLSSITINSSFVDIRNTDIINSYSSGIILGLKDIKPEFYNIRINNSKQYAIKLNENAKPNFSGYMEYNQNEVDGIYLNFPFLEGSNFWGNVESPYYLNRVYTLKNNDSLNIEGNTDILFDGDETGLLLYDSASIEAIGSNISNINFKSYNNYNWGSISLLDNSTGIFKHCNFNNGGNNDFLRYNNFSNYYINQNPNYYGVINALNNNLDVENSNFSNLKNNAIYLHDNSYPNSIENNIFNTSIYTETPTLINNYGIYKHNNDIWNSQSKVYGRYNWWGHRTGPYNAFNNPSGKGTMVSNNIIFEDYLQSRNDSFNHRYRTVYIDNPENESLPTFDKYKSFNINFNKDLDINYINNSFIGVKNSQDKYIPVNVSLDPNNKKIVVISPIGYYPPGSYTIVLKDGIKSIENNLEMNTRVISKFRVK